MVHTSCGWKLEAKYLPVALNGILPDPVP